jgi:hypothetical protein
MPAINNKDRRNFLAALGALSLFSLLKPLFHRTRRNTLSCGPPSTPPQTLRVLGQDGRLVEVDASRVRLLKKKIGDQELKDWVKRPS